MVKKNMTLQLLLKHMHNFLLMKNFDIISLEKTHILTLKFFFFFFLLQYCKAHRQNPDHIICKNFTKHNLTHYLCTHYTHCCARGILPLLYFDGHGNKSLH
uniref:Uncharacterized protein n=1 Tax=Anguilla anguilla TaxID=7936 RepID=A0A0E9X5Q6_ANGAN